MSGVKSGRGGLVEIKEIDGRTLILGRAAHPDTPGHPGVAREYMEIDRFRGSPIWVARSVAKRLVGTHGMWIDNAADRGLIERKQEPDGSIWFRMDPDWNADHLRAQFRADPWTPRTYAEFDLYNSRRTLLAIDANEPYPEHVLESALEILADIGVFSSVEVRGLLIMPRDFEAAYAELSRRRPKVLRNAARRKSAITADDFRLLLPSAIANAPTTCYHADNEDRPAPPATILARLAKLTSLMEVASLYILRVAGRGLQISWIEQATRNLEILDSLMSRSELDIRDQEQISGFLNGLALEDSVGPELSDNHRADLIRLWLSVQRQTSALAIVSPEGETTDLRPFVPAEHARPAWFTAEFNKRFKMTREYSIQRKARASQLAERFDYVIAAARRRCDQVADVADDAFAERSALREGSADRVKVETLSWILNEDGGYAEQGVQTIHGWIWKGEALWRHLARLNSDMGRTLRRRLADAENRKIVLGEDAVYYQYEGASLQDGSAGFDPWFATIFKVGATVSPSHLDAEHRMQRAELIKRWFLPGYHGTSAGILSFDADGSLLYRAAREAGIQLVALDEFDTAMRASHLAFRAGAMTGCRLFESIQMAYHASAWPVLQVAADAARTGWMAVPGKTKDQVRIGDRDFAKRFYMVDDDTYTYFDDLARLVVRRCHSAEGKIPIVDPHPTTAERCSPAPYVFSINGKPLLPPDLHISLRYLLAGIQVCSLHDARHASANRGWVEGEDIEATMLRLGHSVERHSRYYRHAGDGARMASHDNLVRRSGAANMRYWENFCA